MGGKKKRSPVEQQGLQASAEARKLGTGQEEAGVAGESQFLADPLSSPFTKALLTTGRENLSTAYQNAAAGTRERARSAGFGYAQPVAQGADRELQAREASDAARLPQEAVIGAAPIVERGFGDITRAGLGEQGIGADYFRDVMPLEQQYMAYDLGRVPWWQKGLLGGAKIASSFIPGAPGKVISGAISSI